MNELQVNVTQKPGVVQWNFEELANALQEEMAKYEAMVYTDDTIATAKADVAALRKLRKSVEDRRKEIKDKCLEPYNVIEEQAKQLTGLIDKPIKKINEQVTAYTEEQRQKKKKDILAYMTEKFADLPEQVAAKLRFKVYDTKWENATATKKAYKEAIDKAHDATLADLAIMEGVDPDYKEAAMQAFLKDLRLQDAMAKAQELQKQKEIVLENERKRQEERRLKEQAAKAAQELKFPPKEEAETAQELKFPPEPEQAPENSIGRAIGGISIGAFQKAEEKPFGEPVQAGPFEAEKEVALRVYVRESELSEFVMLLKERYMRYEVI